MFRDGMGNRWDLPWPICGLVIGVNRAHPVVLGNFDGGRNEIGFVLAIGNFLLISDQEQEQESLIFTFKSIFIILDL